jgi:hypothetical protein
MSAIGTKRTLPPRRTMSAFECKAEIEIAGHAHQYADTKARYFVKDIR